MPELPEVETVASGLRDQLLGRRIHALELLRASVYRGPDPSVLAGATLRAVRRAGKYLVIDAGEDWQILFHLGMTGRLVIYPPQTPPAPHTHLVMDFESAELHFRDPRRFGRVAVAPAPSDGGFAPEFAVAAGAEPLEIGPDAFAALFHGRSAPIKNALLNQKLLRGLGNIYADESLFRAGIAPRARRLSRPRLLRLRTAIRAVLREAIAAGGSSISDYRDSRGEPGWFHLHHRVYGRTGEPCRNCRQPIRRIVLAGRSAHYCPACQKT